MVIDFKNKTIQVSRGTSVATLMDFMKTIIHQDVNNFEIHVEKEPIAWINVDTKINVPYVSPLAGISATTPNPYTYTASN